MSNKRVGLYTLRGIANYFLDHEMRVLCDYCREVEDRMEFLESENEIYERALRSILNRGTGRCAAVGVTTTTLQKIAEVALTAAERQGARSE